MSGENINQKKDALDYHKDGKPGKLEIKIFFFLFQVALLNHENKHSCDLAFPIQPVLQIEQTG